MFQMPQKTPFSDQVLTDILSALQSSLGRSGKMSQAHQERSGKMSAAVAPVSFSQRQVGRLLGQSQCFFLS